MRNFFEHHAYEQNNHVWDQNEDYKRENQQHRHEKPTLPKYLERAVRLLVVLNTHFTLGYDSLRRLVLLEYEYVRCESKNDKSKFKRWINVLV